MCIKVLGGSRRRFAGLGDVIICSVKSVIPGSEVKKKAVVRGVIVRAEGAEPPAATAVTSASTRTPWC